MKLGRKKKGRGKKDPPSSARASVAYHPEKKRRPMKTSRLKNAKGLRMTKKIPRGKGDLRFLARDKEKWPFAALGKRRLTKRGGNSVFIALKGEKKGHYLTRKEGNVHAAKSSLQKEEYSYLRSFNPRERIRKAFISNHLSEEGKKGHLRCGSRNEEVKFQRGWTPRKGKEEKKCAGAAFLKRGSFSGRSAGKMRSANLCEEGEATFIYCREKGRKKRL